MIPYKNRFHGHGSIKYLYQNGKSARSHFAIIKVVSNPHRKHSRFAVVVSKKVIKSAVGRNSIRRRVYEYLRNRFSGMGDVCDMVVIVLSGEMLTLSHNDMKSHLDQLFDQFNFK